MWSCRDSCDSLGELTDVVTSYFSFCVDTVLPVKKSKVFPNDKLSVSKGLNENGKHLCGKHLLSCLSPICIMAWVKDAVAILINFTLCLSS